MAPYVGSADAQWPVAQLCLVISFPGRGQVPWCCLHSGIATSPVPTSAPSHPPHWYPLAVAETCGAVETGMLLPKHSSVSPTLSSSLPFLVWDTMCWGCPHGPRNPQHDEASLLPVGASPLPTRASLPRASLLPTAASPLEHPRCPRPVQRWRGRTGHPTLGTPSPRPPPASLSLPGPKCQYALGDDLCKSLFQRTL